ncbi:hypothetical protein TNCV_4990551 [Trichonephila clavipes]|nr:hypothetical protein TNCV_4990551 [Trichonephila clavipes]
MGQLDPEVHEQMSRSSGQSEARSRVFKSPSKLGTHLSTHCTKSLDSHVVADGGLLLGLTHQLRASRLSDDIRCSLIGFSAKGTAMPTCGKLINGYLLYTALVGL